LLQAKCGIRALMILDDNLTLDTRRLSEICGTMLAKGMDFTWYCQRHVKFATDDRLKVALR
jgi:hypothetical protein